MSYPVFQVPAGDVLPVMFSSYAGSTGASVTLTGLAVTDIEIYKDGSATQRASDAGYTLLDTDGIDFDAITGIHGFSIDTGDNTDAGFYTVGSWFTVVVSAVTVDSQTVNFIACQFRIMAAESIAGKPKVDVDGWLGTACATPTVAGVPEVDITHIGGDAQSGTDLKDFADAGYDPATNKVQGVVLVDTLTTYTGNTPQTGDAYARLGAPAGASVSADIAAAQADIDTLLSQVANIAAVGTAVNVVAESYTLTTGTQTSGTYTSTALFDGVPHTHTDTAGTLDLYYQFDIGVQGLPSLVGLTAYANGASDDLAIQAYNWGGATWETVGTLIGKSGSTYDSYTYTLLTRHAGTGANVGKVRIRFYSAALTSATLRVDQLFVSYATSQTYQYTAGVVNDAAATTSSFKTNLTQVDNFWNDALLVFTSGSLAGQAKPIQDFANTNGVITLDEVLTSAPANGDAFVIKAEHIHPVAQIVDGVWDEPLTGATHNIATSAGRRLRSFGDVVSATVNDASATTTSFITSLTSSVNDFYIDQTLYFDTGSLTGSSRIITGYNGTTKAVTFDEAWPLAPGNGDAFTIDPTHIHSVTQMQAGLATAANLATLTGYVDTEVAAIKAKTDNLPASPAATGDIPTVSQIWTTALTEAYRSAGSTGTAAQLLHEILQNLTEFSISGTTKTVKKFDASTTAKTYTLNSATTPTSITETT